MTSRFQQKLAIIATVMLVSACATSPPEQTDNVCDIFRESLDGTLMPRNPAPAGEYPFQYRWPMHQESRFVATPSHLARNCGFHSRPSPLRFLWLFAGQKQHLEWYQRSTGNYGADRDDFGDAIDFIGWYNNVSNEQLGIDKQDAFRLYLAYHEGHGGYRKQSYRSKEWLVDVARKVDRQANRYNSQLQTAPKN